ncbi:MAG: hypothetical protein ABNO50_00600 [Candidatus Shikimatogenerans sp. Tduv]|uniref:Uncharacterized protein n=1 Tax=Candidatus Shikimatogenerans sp. Tduv TaxID=3158567 RepID=A0AAU7QTS3_9FLAO
MKKYILNIIKTNKHIYIQLKNIKNNIINYFFTTNKKKYIKYNKKEKKKKIIKEIILKIIKKKKKIYLNKNIKYKGFNKILINKLRYYNLL